jgi:maltose O-acetyltransferase
MILKRGGLKIGKGCFISHSALIDPSFLNLIEIGNNVTITADVTILAHDSSMKRHLGLTRIGKIKILDNVFIGSGSIILPNVTIGSNSIIGAGSIVTNNISANVVVAGNPAKEIYSLESFLAKNRSQINCSPQFSSCYSVDNISKILRDKMSDELENTQGYIV